MKARGLAETFCDDPFVDARERESRLFTSNIQLHYMTAGRPIHAQSLMVRGLKPAKRADGQMQYPPILVWDMDDDLEMISPVNPKFATLGTRDGDGNLLLPRSELGIKFEDKSFLDPTASEPVFLWKHGQETQHGIFRAEDNVVLHAGVRKMAATAHAITCTSQELADVVKGRWNKNVFVYPNSLLFDDFHTFDIRRRTDEVRVLWQGGYSHFPDFYPLQRTFKDAATGLPEVKWVMFGTKFRWITDVFPAGKMEFHPWVAHELYHMKLGTLSADINIAPLADTRFNRCKSAIKWYEASALRVPTLAQRAGPYAHEIADGVTGYLFATPEEFQEKLTELVKNVDLRHKMGERAYEWTRENRDALKTVEPLAEFYRKLVKDVHGLEV